MKDLLNGWGVTIAVFLPLVGALVMLAFALVALLAPSLWHKFDVRNSMYRQKSYASFAAEFLDSIQGLATQIGRAHV